MIAVTILKSLQARFFGKGITFEIETEKKCYNREFNQAWNNIRYDKDKIADFLLTTICVACGYNDVRPFGQFWSSDPDLQCDESIVELVLQVGSENNIKIDLNKIPFKLKEVVGEDDFSITALMFAAKKKDIGSEKHLKLITILIKNGADIAIKDKNGHDAYWYAIQGNNIEIAEFLYQSTLDSVRESIKTNTSMDFLKSIRFLVQHKVPEFSAEEVKALACIEKNVHDESYGAMAFAVKNNHINEFIRIFSLLDFPENPDDAVKLLKLILDITGCDPLQAENFFEKLIDSGKDNIFFESTEEKSGTLKKCMNPLISSIKFLEKYAPNKIKIPESIQEFHKIYEKEDIYSAFLFKVRSSYEDVDEKTFLIAEEQRWLESPELKKIIHHQVDKFIEIDQCNKIASVLKFYPGWFSHQDARNSLLRLIKNQGNNIKNIVRILSTERANLIQALDIFSNELRNHHELREDLQSYAVSMAVKEQNYDFLCQIADVSAKGNKAFILGMVFQVKVPDNVIKNIMSKFIDNQVDISNDLYIISYAGNKLQSKVYLNLLEETVKRAFFKIIKEENYLEIDQILEYYPKLISATLKDDLTPLMLLVNNFKYPGNNVHLQAKLQGFLRRVSLDWKKEFSNPDNNLLLHASLTFCPNQCFEDIAKRFFMTNLQSEIRCRVTESIYKSLEENDDKERMPVLDKVIKHSLYNLNIEERLMLFKTLEKISYHSYDSLLEIFYEEDSGFYISLAKVETDPVKLKALEKYLLPTPGSSLLTWFPSRETTDNSLSRPFLI